MRCVIVISLCFVMGIKSALLNKEEGEKCNLDDEEWLCQTPNNCPQIGDIRRNRPDICGFKEKVPIICCPPDKSAQPEPTLNVEDVPLNRGTSEKPPEISSVGTSNKPPAPSGSTVPGSPPIALMKCIEYEVKICREMLGNGKEKTRRIRDISETPNTHKDRIGGNPAAENQFPFIAVIGFGEEPAIKWECGGTLVSETWVLSAAHCAHSSSGTAKWIGIGSEKIYPEFTGLIIPISQILIHPSYKAPAIYHDIALFQHEMNLGFNYFVRPACLHALKVLPRYAVATGWETNSFEAKGNTDLFYFDMVNADPQVCNQVYNNYTLFPRGYDNEIMFCAGETKKDSCAGGSGGPIFYNSSICLTVQLGISSIRNNCGINPGVFTRISYYIPWIERIIWPNAKPESFFT